MKSVVVFVSLLAALGLTAASTEWAGNQMEMEDGAYAYQWAELADTLSAVDQSVLESSETQKDYTAELMELKAALNIESLIQGSGHDDGEHDAALLEMEMTSALSSEATPSDFFRFARTNSRLYASQKAAAAAFAAFKVNKKAAAELNAEFGVTSEQHAVFAATGPLASMSPQAFKSKILNAKNPRGRGRNKRVRLKSHPYGKSKGKGKKDKQNSKNDKPKANQFNGQSKSAAANSNGKKSKNASRLKNASKSNKTSKSKKTPKSKKASVGAAKSNKSKGKKSKVASGSKKTAKETTGKPGVDSDKPRRSRKVVNVSLQPTQQHGGGHAAGFAGYSAGQSGKTGGQSGKTGGKSGKSGGKSGKQGGKSGKQGGKSGKEGGKSGKTGGGGVVHSSVANGTIALPSRSNPNLTLTRLTAPVGYTDPAVAAKMGITLEFLKRKAATGGIGFEAFDESLKTLRQMLIVSRAMQYNDRGELVTLEPVQINDCGSCWAIAAQQSLQRYWTGAAFKGVLSIQQLLDCARTVDSKGCRGGTPMDALEYWARNLGAVNRDYPVVMKDQACKKPPFQWSQVAYPSAGWEMLIPECNDNDKDCTEQIKFELMVLGFTREKNFQPPIAYVDASQWQNYRGGIFPPTKCSSTMEAGNHVVQIVGSGVDNLGIPYWILDNFWGSNWGEGGRIRVPFGVNSCGLFNFVIYSKPPPFASGSANQVPSFNAKPAPYVPQPVQLHKVETSNGVLGRTSEMFASPMQAGLVVPKADPRVGSHISPASSSSQPAQPVVVPQFMPHLSVNQQGSTGGWGAQ